MSGFPRPPATTFRLVPFSFSQMTSVPPRSLATPFPTRWNRASSGRILNDALAAIELLTQLEEKQVLNAFGMYRVWR